MANIPAVRPRESVGFTVVTPIAVGVSNTLTYNPAYKQVLYVRNASGASVTLTLDGADAPSTVKVPGTGAAYSTAAGASIVVAAGALVAIPLENYRAYLVGAVTLAVSLATDVTAWLVEV